MALIDPDGRQSKSLALEGVKIATRSRVLEQFIESIAPILELPLSPLQIVISSICTPSYVGKGSELFEFRKIGEDTWLYTGPIGGEITVYAEDAESNEDGKQVESDGTKKESDKKTDLRPLDKKEAKKYAEEKGYDKVEKFKEDVLGGSKVDKNRAGSYDIYKDKKSGEHYLKPKSQFGKKLPTIKIND